MQARCRMEGWMRPQGARLAKAPVSKLGRPARLCFEARSASEGKDLAPSYGGVPPGNNVPGGGGGRGDGDGGNGAGGAGAVLAGKALESLPADLAQAMKDGKLPAEMLQRYLDLNKNPFFAWLMSIG